MLPKDGFDVVISGVGARLPEVNNLAELRDKLFDKANLVKDTQMMSHDGINVPKTIGQIKDKYKFDAGFCGIHQRLAMLAEPMHATVEQCFEAIIDAGVNPASLWGSNTAVFAAVCNSESDTMILSHRGFTKNGFGVLGQSHAIISNRISFLFNFVGHSITINAGLGGGLQVLKQAATLIRQGRASAALVTTGYIMSTPYLSKEYCDLNMLTFKHTSCPFDADADGFIRSDGIVAYFLQRKEDALRIYASLEDVDSTCLGSRECSLINMDSKLTDFLTNFYKNSDFNQSDLAYLEPEALAIKEKDALELNALANVLLPGRKLPLQIGSVKTNLGHTHVSSTFASMAKAIIALETGKIPPTLHYKKPNPQIPDLVSRKFVPITEETKLTGDSVAVNSLSLSGVVGHVLLKQHRKAKIPVTHHIPRLVLFSCRHVDGANTIIQEINSMKYDTEYYSLVNNVFKTTIPKFIIKGFTIPSTGSTKAISDFVVCETEKRPLWYVISGMGSQWAGMGRDLLKIPVFAAAVDKCDKVLSPRGLDIKEIISTEDRNVFDDILNSFIGITTVQIGIVEILKAIGAEPDGIVGHSAGEVCCGYVDGCLTIEQTVLAAYMRGKAVNETTLCKGMMAAVGLGYQEIKNMLPPTVDVACRNAADNCTISGPQDEVVQLLQEFTKKGIFAKAVNTSERAFHSRYVKDIGPHLETLLKEVIPNPQNRSAKWISTSVPKNCWNTENAKKASHVYFSNNMISPVYFEEGCKFIPNNAIVVEIAPHGLMQAILRRSLPQENVNISLSSRTVESNLMHLLSGLGKMFIHNLDLDVNAMYHPVQYPVSRGTPPLAPLVIWDHTETFFTEFTALMTMLTQAKWEWFVSINNESSSYPLWMEHRVNNNTILCTAEVLSYAWNVLSKAQQCGYEEQVLEMTNVVISGKVVLKQVANQEIVSSLFRGSRRFEVWLEENNQREVIMSGIISSYMSQNPLAPRPLLPSDRPAITIDGTNFYKMFALHGYELGPSFRNVKSVKVSEKDYEAIVIWTGSLVLFLESLFKLAIFANIHKDNKVVEIHTLTHLIINTPLLVRLSEGTEIPVLYSCSTNSLTCNGLLIESMKFSTKSFSPSPTSNLNWNCLNFVSYKERVDKLEVFLNFTLQLIAEQDLSSWHNKAVQICLSVVEDSSTHHVHKINTTLPKVLTSLPGLTINFKSNLQEIRKEFGVITQKCCLVVGNSTSVLNVANSTKQDNVFYLAVTQESALSFELKGLHPILTHQIDDDTLLILLKKQSVAPNKLRVFELDCMVGLRQFMDYNTSASYVFVVSRHWHPMHVLRALASEPYAHKLRCVFLNKNNPPMQMATPSFLKQLALALSVNVLIGDHWGSYRSLDISHMVSSDMSHTPPFDCSQKDLQISCISLNTATLSLPSEITPDKDKTKYVDYCGFRSSQERVIGVGVSDQSTREVIPDEILQWTVPAAWLDVDAVTVPYIYSLAYYSLLVVGRLVGQERVVVQGGMSPAGQAALAVSLDIGADVFCTVNDDSQVKALQATFPQINPLHIINMARSNFEIEIMKLTKCKGVNVVLNCMKGEAINRFLKILAMSARFIHLSEIRVEDRDTIGMFPFLNRVAVYGVTYCSIINASKIEKKMLQSLIEDGIARGIVKPLKQNAFSIKQSSEALHNMNHSLEKTVIRKGSSHYCGSDGFQCSPSVSFIIIGTKQRLWLEVAEWLLKKGARKLIFVSKKENLTNSISTKLNHLINQHCAVLHLYSISRLDTIETAKDFLKEADRMGSIAGIFCMFMSENSAYIANLDAATRLVVSQLQQFVCLLGGSARVCESRTLAGKSACLVQNELLLTKPQAILPYLSSILTDQRFSGNIFNVANPSGDANPRGTNVSHVDVQIYLPRSLEELCDLGEASSDEIVFRETTTLSPLYEYSRLQLLPVFLIPGLSSESLTSIIRHLMHPAFCLVVPPTHPTLEASANYLLQQILKIQAKGPYNIVGESWSGTLALHLAVLLEGLGHQVELFLVDPAPSTDKQWVQTFCTSERFSDIKYLSLLLKMDTKIFQIISKLTKWEDQLDLAVQQLHCPPKVSVKNICTFLTQLRTRLLAILQGIPSNQVFNGTVHLIQTVSGSKLEHCGVREFCKKAPTIADGMSNHKTIANIINENMLFTWDN